MFYRFKSKLATQDRLEAFPVPTPGSNKNHRSPVISKYEDRLKKIDKNIFARHFQVFKAPDFGGDEYGFSMRFHEGKETGLLPDIWGVAEFLIVSDKFKNVIAELDEMKHGYIPISWIDSNEKEVEMQQQYYWFDPKRFLKVKVGGRVATSEELGFFPLPEEEDFLAQVIDGPSLREKIEQIPIWRHIHLEGVQGRFSQARMVFYFNEVLVMQLQAARIKGIDQYSVKYGLGEESICAV